MPLLWLCWCHFIINKFDCALNNSYLLWHTDCCCLFMQLSSVQQHNHTTYKFAHTHLHSQTRSKLENEHRITISCGLTRPLCHVFVLVAFCSLFPDTTIPRMANKVIAAFICDAVRFLCSSKLLRLQHHCHGTLLHFSSLRSVFYRSVTFRTVPYCGK